MAMTTVNIRKEFLGDGLISRGLRPPTSLHHKPSSPPPRSFSKSACIKTAFNFTFRSGSLFILAPGSFNRVDVDSISDVSEMRGIHKAQRSNSRTNINKTKVSHLSMILKWITLYKLDCASSTRERVM
jgi:hypothetical protein